jgi:protein SCO1
MQKAYVHRASFLPAIALAALLLHSASQATTYPASGLILRVDRSHLSLELSCQAIPGYMDAMMMTLPVRNAAALEGLKPGMLIDFDLAVKKNTAYAERIRVHAYENTAQEPMAERQLEILDAATTVSSPDMQSLQIGQPVPNFTLIDQNRDDISFSQFAGHVLAITFIYTRCPLPNFCFRMSNNFGVLQRRFAQRMGKDLVLLSVTFDPEHDRPEVLAEYARTWTKDQTGWHFLTGPTPDVEKVCSRFGVKASQDEGFFTHSLRTVVIDRRGRVAANLEGNEYTTKQLGDLVESVIDTPD